jgi:hypothetical protein
MTGGVEGKSLEDALTIRSRILSSFEEAEREITGEHVEWTDRSNYAITSKDGFRRDNPATDAARHRRAWNVRVPRGGGSHAPILTLTGHGPAHLDTPTRRIGFGPGNRAAIGGHFARMANCTCAWLGCA